MVTEAPSTALRPPTRGELAFYELCRKFAVGASRLYFPGPVSGAEHVPAEGAFILAPSHRSYVDWLIAARITRPRLRYLVKAEVWKSKAVGRLIETLGAFPVQRGTADRHALTVARSVLEFGEPLVIFPEGTRQRGPEIAELQEGTAYLALRARVPIVPLGLGGTEGAMPRGSAIPRPSSVRLIVGEPLLPEEFLGDEPGERVPRSATRACTEALRSRLQALFDEAEGRSRP